MIEDGVPEGVFIGYYENGELAIEEVFLNGKPISNPQCFDPIGKLIPFHKTSSIKPLLEENYWNKRSSGYGG
jgi:antitoxin component YwqK of YwqJK toxin-antitoxin module